MKTIIQTLFLILACNIGLSQTWSVLQNAPVASWRHDDAFFINPDTGWVVNVDGNIYQTKDGGNQWDTLINNSNTAFRCIGFSDSQTGWVGNLGPGNWSPTLDTVPLYQTNDGGVTWAPISNVTGIIPSGICGINVVNDTVVYAVGRVKGPSYILKTTNKGNSWKSIDMNGYCQSLIDCYFFHPDSGFVIGNNPGVDFLSSKAVILSTTDGGNTWSPAFESTHLGTLSWKISFPSSKVGYVSIESSGMDSTFVLKTVDQGLNWTEQIVIEQEDWLQGIGFINDSIGWTGANNAYVTHTGGNLWDTISFVKNFNRFRKVNDTLAFAVGKEVWKLSMQPITSVNNISHSKKVNHLKQNYPNPFSEKTIIPYTVPTGGAHVQLNIYDFPGRHLTTLVDKFQPSGNYEIEFNIPYLENVMFFYALTINGDIQTKTMVQFKQKK